jgi:hypothetical protein
MFAKPLTIVAASLWSIQVGVGVVVEMVVAIRLKQEQALLYLF